MIRAQGSFAITRRIARAKDTLRLMLRTVVGDFTEPLGEFSTTDPADTVVTMSISYHVSVMLDAQMRIATYPNLNAITGCAFCTESTTFVATHTESGARVVVISVVGTTFCSAFGGF